ncbi:MAG TPA: serine/threonine-protein kinase [Luteolibacter sp.]|nr:serine/threonine-protein kinase [Luteolibacter sp.]
MSTEHDPHALPLPCRIGRYRLECVLGRGGFGFTYLAIDSELGRKVAIKELFPSELAIRKSDFKVTPRSPREHDSLLWAKERFLDEARTIARFEDEHLVKVHEHFEANNTAYIVMGFVEGLSLNEFMTERPHLDFNTLQSIIAPLLRALESVHGQGFLHRDIKPDNIRISRGIKPVLIDFGAARMAVGQQSHEVTTLLTRSYAPIEQYQENGKLGPWSDIYSLGAVIHKMLRGKTPPEAISRLRDDPYQPLVADPRLSHLPSFFLSAVDWMLAPLEHERPQTVGTLLPRLWGGDSSTIPGQATWAPAPDWHGSHRPGPVASLVPPAASHSPEQVTIAPFPSSGLVARMQPDGTGSRKPMAIALMGLALILVGAGFWAIDHFKKASTDNTARADDHASRQEPPDIAPQMPSGEAVAGAAHTTPPEKSSSSRPVPPVPESVATDADFDRARANYTTGDQKIFTIRVTQADRDLAVKRIQALEASGTTTDNDDTIGILRKIREARGNEIYNLAEDACSVIRGMEGTPESILDRAYQNRLAELQSNAALKNISTTLQQDALKLFHDLTKLNKSGVKITPNDVSSRTESLTIPQ